MKSKYLRTTKRTVTKRRATKRRARRIKTKRNKSRLRRSRRNIKRHPRRKRTKKYKKGGMRESDLHDHEDMGKHCPICLENHGEGDVQAWVTTPCNHSMHRECLRTWMNHNNSCPMCRAPLPTFAEIDFPGDPNIINPVIDDGDGDYDNDGDDDDDDDDPLRWAEFEFLGQYLQDYDINPEGLNLEERREMVAERALFAPLPP